MKGNEYFRQNIFDTAMYYIQQEDFAHILDLVPYSEEVDYQKHYQKIRDLFAEYHQDDALLNAFILDERMIGFFAALKFQHDLQNFIWFDGVQRKE